MLKIITTIIITLSASLAYAQGLGESIMPPMPEPDQNVQPQPQNPNYGGLQRYETGILCGPTTLVAGRLTARGLKFFVTGQKYPQDPGVFSHTALLINPQTGEYSFVFISDQYGMTCIVHQGTNLTLLSPEDQ